VSNPGTTDISGVEIEVGETQLVGPAQSQSSFFVGNITSSDFTNFQVNAQLRTRTNQTMTVPLRTSYVIDGVRQERIVEVEYDPQAARAGGEQGQMQRQAQSDSSGLPLGLVGVVLVVALAVFGWRRYRG
jgi:cobalamin biosynthesis Mg chelatase CobN